MSIIKNMNEMMSPMSPILLGGATMACLFKAFKSKKSRQWGIGSAFTAIALTAFCFSENKSSNFMQKFFLMIAGATAINVGQGIRSGNRRQVIMNGAGGVLMLAFGFFI